MLKNWRDTTRDEKTTYLVSALEELNQASVKDIVDWLEREIGELGYLDNRSKQTSISRHLVLRTDYFEKNKKQHRNYWSLISPTTDSKWSESDQYEYDEPSDDEKEIIELFAVEKAEQYYEHLGYKIVDVSTPSKAINAGLSDWPGYDLRAKKGSEIKRIEVKGTKQGYGRPVKITSNEVKRAKENFRDYYLFIVYSIVIENKQAKDGVIKIIEQWNPENSLDNGELVPKDYLFTPKRKNNNIS